MKPNFVNRTMWEGDNLDVLRGINSECVDLIYLDPPFNSNKTYAAPIGSEAAGASFKDAWSLDDVDEAWHGEIADREPALHAVIDAAKQSHGASMKAYTIMMAVRLLEMRRVLKPTGSIYLHCDPTASHYLKLVMDSVFVRGGGGRFLNEIVWCYRKLPNNIRAFQRNHDVLLAYTKTDEFTFNRLYGEMTPESKRTFESARRRGYNANNAKRMVTVFDWDKYHAAVAASKLPSDLKPVEFKGGRPTLRDWWDDIKILGGPKNRERTGYPTQKPIALLERIIAAASNPGDVVIDPFAGCATTCVAAETLSRQWAGIDLSPLAVKLVRNRLRDQHGLFGQIVARDDIPQRTDLVDLPNYRTRKHHLFGRQEGVCRGCLVVFPFRNFTVDHVVPTSKGGTDHEDNLQLLCGACNSKKGSGSMAELIARLKNEGVRAA